MTEITRVPHRLESFLDEAGRPMRGWTVAQFTSPEEAAKFVTANPQAAMPCWKRMLVVDGRLVLRQEVAA